MCLLKARKLFSSCPKTTDSHGKEGCSGPQG